MAAAAGPQDKIVAWKIVQRTMFEIFKSCTEITYMQFKKALTEKCGRATYEKYKRDIQDHLQDFVQKRQQEKMVMSPLNQSNKLGMSAPSLRTKTPPPNSGTNTVSAPSLPASNSGTPHAAESADTLTPLRKASKIKRQRSRPTALSFSSQAQMKLESILNTPAGMEILNKEARASGHDLEACRAKLIRAVRTAAKLKRNMQRLSTRGDLGAQFKAYAAKHSPKPGSPNTSSGSPHNAVDPKLSNSKSPPRRSRRRSLSAGKISIPAVIAGGGAMDLSPQSPNSPSNLRYTSTRTVNKAIRKFNLNVKMGMKDLMRENVVGDNPADIGNFLRVTKGLNKEHVGEVLGRPEDFYLSVLDAYVSGCEFKGLEYKLALRQFLNSFKLPGEAQKIERIVATFAKYYSEKNPTSALKNQDTVFVVCYALLMLNTSLHSTKVKEKDRMTKEDFIKMLLGCDDGQDLPADVIGGIYDDIKAQGLFNKKERADVSGTLFTKPKLTGPMTKRTSRQLLYQKRWMILTQENQLYYFKNKDAVNPLGFIDVASARMKVRHGCIKLVPVKGQKQVKSIKIWKDKPSELGRHDLICLKVPKVDKNSDLPGFDDWVAAIAAICGLEPATPRGSMSPRSPRSPP